MIGQTLQNGKYEIKRVLGQGGFGITYEGIQAGLERKVAIKEFIMKVLARSSCVSPCFSFKPNERSGSLWAV